MRAVALAAAAAKALPVVFDRDRSTVESLAQHAFDIVTLYARVLYTLLMTCSYALKTPEEYARDTGTAVPASKKYFKHSNIPDIIRSYPMPHRRKAAAAASAAAAGNAAAAAVSVKDVEREVRIYVNLQKL